MMRPASGRKLTEEEIQNLIAEYAKTKDPAIRDEIVMQYTNLVESVARRFLGACEPPEDLVQEGFVGLIRSVDKYDPAMGVKFSTYATHFIIGEIKHYLRDKGKMIKEPAWLQELNQKMTRVVESLSQALGRTPTEKEIAQVMQMPESSIRELLMTREVFKVTSLDGEREDASGPKESEKIKDEKLIAFQLPVEDKIVLETALQKLKDIEQQVIYSHFYKGLNQTEIAKQLGISCNYVSHILRNGTKKLRKILITDEVRDIQIQRALLSTRAKEGRQIEPESVLDPTTRVYNRRYFLQRLDEELSRAFRERYTVALLLVDVKLPDNMDRYLRLIRKDDILFEVAQTIRSNVRKMDLVARIGDQCFGLILPHTFEHAATVAERLSKLVQSVSVDPGRGAAQLSCSGRIGVAKYPADSLDSRGLLQAAASQLDLDLEELMNEPTERFGLAA
ncbi:MAG: sigma-70 family RNA polymerase sigma factor [Armatimonadota bacterium]|nr:sigma-70 family RNA polymerase sigma factor [Armatimonadota bacterium]